MKKLFIVVFIIMGLVCFNLSAIAQDTTTSTPPILNLTNPYPNGVPLWAQAVYPKGYTGPRTGVFGNGSGALPTSVYQGVSGGGPGVFPGSIIDPLNPVDPVVFGPDGSLYNWVFPLNGEVYDNSLCPWR